jgi:hypothetical protein
MDWESLDEEAARRLVESITRRIDPHAQVLLREPGRRVMANRLRLAVIQQGHTFAFELTVGELREAQSALGRERLARRLGATLGLQPPDQLTGPPRDSLGITRVAPGLQTAALVRRRSLTLDRQTRSPRMAMCAS